MPTYDYVCVNCMHEYEYFHVNKEDTQQCPKCSSREAEKLPPKKTSFQLKGGGWYSGGYSTGKKGKR